MILSLYNFLSVFNIDTLAVSLFQLSPVKRIFSVWILSVCKRLLYSSSIT